MTTEATDRLTEIKRHLRKGREFGTGLPYEQAAWLVAEVERLRAEVAQRESVTLDWMRQWEAMRAAFAELDHKYLALQVEAVALRRAAVVEPPTSEARISNGFELLPLARDLSPDSTPIPTVPTTTVNQATAGTPTGEEPKP